MSLHEGMKEGERWQTLQEFMGTDQGVLFTTYALCGRGLPFPGLSKVVGLGGSVGPEALEGLERQRAPAELILFQGLDEDVLVDFQEIRQVELVKTPNEAPPFTMAEDFYLNSKHRLNWKRSLQSLVQVYENRYARKLTKTEKELVGRLFQGHPHPKSL